jgi:hypothetical protein
MGLPHYMPRGETPGLIFFQIPKGAAIALDGCRVRTPAHKPRDHGYTTLAIWENRRGFRRGHECVCRRDPRHAVFEDIIAGIANTSATDEAPLIFGDLCVRNAANGQTIWRDETTKW